jgi:hypothetical protein
LLRQMMYRRIMLACSLWVAWSVPSSAKYRSAVNWASSGNPGALPRWGPLRTGRARFPGSSAQASPEGSLPGRSAGLVPFPMRLRQ